MIDFLLECAWISFQAGVGAIVITTGLGVTVTVLGLVAVGIEKLSERGWARRHERRGQE